MKYYKSNLNDKKKETTYKRNEINWKQTNFFGGISSRNKNKYFFERRKKKVLSLSSDIKRDLTIIIWFIYLRNTGVFDGKVLPFIGSFGCLIEFFDVSIRI